MNPWTFALIPIVLLLIVALPGNEWTSLRDLLRGVRSFYARLAGRLAHGLFVAIFWSIVGVVGLALVAALVWPLVGVFVAAHAGASAAVVIGCTLFLYVALSRQIARHSR